MPYRLDSERFRIPIAASQGKPPNNETPELGPGSSTRNGKQRKSSAVLHHTSSPKESTSNQRSASDGSYSSRSSDVAVPSDSELPTLSGTEFDRSNSSTTRRPAGEKKTEETAGANKTKEAYSGRSAKRPKLPVPEGTNSQSLGPVTLTSNRLTEPDESNGCKALPEAFGITDIIARFASGLLSLSYREPANQNEISLTDKLKKAHKVVNELINELNTGRPLRAFQDFKRKSENQGKSDEKLAKQFLEETYSGHLVHLRDLNRLYISYEQKLLKPQNDLGLKKLRKASELLKLEIDSDREDAFIQKVSTVNQLKQKWFKQLTGRETAQAKPQQNIQRPPEIKQQKGPSALMKILFNENPPIA
ncbi:MAG: hypothetical protein AAGI66_06615 [Cyanobacteria bacterium P01_H01_bin.74]